MKKTPERKRAIRVRRFSIAGLTIVGLVIAKLVVLAFEPFLDSAAERFAELGTLWVCVFSVVLTTAVLVPLAAGRCGGFAGARYFGVYPPIWLPVLLATMILLSLEYWCPDWKPMSSNQLRLDNWAAVRAPICVGCGFFFAMGIAWLTSPTVREPVVLTKINRGSDSIKSVDDLLSWLATDDEPVRIPSQDLFDHAAIAKRIARRLARRTNGVPDGPTFVLIGPRGSGKTSIYHLVQYELQALATEQGASEDRVCVDFVWLSAWKYSDTKALLRGVLSKVVDLAHSRVDAWALTGLPSSYVEAISASGGIAGSLARLLQPIYHQPEDVIDRINTILCAIDVLVVVWIDDLERFRSQDRSVESVRALLEQFRDSSFITFVLAEAQE